MVCIEKIYSVSALVGDGTCNANCDFCAGKYLRKDTKESTNYHKNLESSIKLSARYGGWSLSLTSSGEPTCNPDDLTKALEVYQKCANQGAYFPNVNLFTNGILFGDDDFCNEHLPRWKELGLTYAAISIHDSDEKKQAEVYNVKNYPEYERIIGNIHKHGLGARCTLLLRKGAIDDAKTYEQSVDTLIGKGFDNITSWPIGNPDATRNEYSPSRLGMLGIRRWLASNTKKCIGHVWGGGVFDYNGNMLRLTDYVTKHNPRKDFVRQLVVFHDGAVHYSWIKKGSLCMK